MTTTGPCTLSGDRVASIHCQRQPLQQPQCQHHPHQHPQQTQEPSPPPSPPQVSSLRMSAMDMDLDSTSEMPCKGHAETDVVLNRQSPSDLQITYETPNWIEIHLAKAKAMADKEGKRTLRT